MFALLKLRSFIFIGKIINLGEIIWDYIKSLLCSKTSSTHLQLSYIYRYYNLQALAIIVYFAIITFSCFIFQKCSKYVKQESFWIVPFHLFPHYFHIKERTKKVNKLYLI